MSELVASVEVGAPAQAVWDAVVDWDVQSEWMFLTSVRGGHGEGAYVEAFTGVGRIGFLDTMEITVWDPPRRCVVRHTGRVVRGTAAFEVEPLGPGRSRFTWVEWVVPPLGTLGAAGLGLVRPLVMAPIRYSLRRLAARLGG